VGWLRSLRNSVHVLGRTLVHPSDARPVGQQTTRLDPFAEAEHRCDTIAKRQVGEACAIPKKEWRHQNEEDLAIDRRVLGERTIVVIGLFALIPGTRNPSLALASLAASHWSADIRSQNTVAACMSGNASFTSCRRFTVSSICRRNMPVILPLGRARLVT